MRASHTKTFETSQGPAEFTIVQLGGMSAGREFIRLAPIIPPLLGSIFPKGLPKVEGKSFDSKRLVADLLKSDIDFSRVGGALATLKPEDFEAVAVALLTGAEAVLTDGTGEAVKLTINRAQLDSLFRGQVWELFKLIGFAVTVNYFSFSPAPSATE